jgi:hypothetical protein
MAKVLDISETEASIPLMQTPNTTIQSYVLISTIRRKPNTCICICICICISSHLGHQSGGCGKELSYTKEAWFSWNQELSTLELLVTVTKVLETLGVESYKRKEKQQQQQQRVVA